MTRRRRAGRRPAVKIAKADLVPADANLLPEYGSFAGLEEACLAFWGQVKALPPQRAGQAVRVRRHGDQVVITHVGQGGPAEVARHLVTAPGSPRVDDSHYPPPPPGALERTPRARTAAEAGFLAIGDGAGLWLAEAAAAGTGRVRAKMARAVQLAALHGTAEVDRALGKAAAAGRFADGDLAAILAHQATAAPGGASRAGERRTLAQGTGGRARHDRPEAGRWA